MPSQQLTDFLLASRLCEVLWNNDYVSGGTSVFIASSADKGSFYETTDLSHAQI